MNYQNEAETHCFGNKIGFFGRRKQRELVKSAKSTLIEKSMCMCEFAY